METLNIQKTDNADSFHEDLMEAILATFTAKRFYQFHQSQTNLLYGSHLLPPIALTGSILARVPSV